MGEITTQIDTVAQRTLDYISGRPDGVRLVEMEQEFHLPRLQAWRMVRHLIDDGKVEKRKSLYFAL